MAKQMRRYCLFSMRCKFLAPFINFEPGICQLWGMLRYWPLLLALLAICACEKTPDPGPQYTLSADFIASTTFRDSTKWQLLDAQGNPFDTLTLIEKDTMDVMPAPGTPGYFLKDYRLQFSKRILSQDTVGLTDSLKNVRDSVRSVSWRILPFDSAFAGSLTGGAEEILYFHSNTLQVGEQRQGCIYQGQVVITLPGAVPTIITTGRYIHEATDSTRTKEVYWAKRYGPVSYVDGLGRQFYLRKL